MQAKEGTCDRERALLAGATLGEAAETGVAADGAFDFGTALVGLAGLGAFVSIIDPRDGAHR